MQVRRFSTPSNPPHRNGRQRTGVARSQARAGAGISRAVARVIGLNRHRPRGRRANRKAVTDRCGGGVAAPRQTPGWLGREFLRFH